MNNDIHFVEFNMYQGNKGYYYLNPSEFPINSDLDFLNIKLTRGDDVRIYPIYRQAAMMYGNRSGYVSHHGCACCSLASILAAHRPELQNYMPQDIISIIEPEVLSTTEWAKNYNKEFRKQMPLSLKGISQIMKHYGIEHRYIATFKTRFLKARMLNHLLKGKPIIIETSRVRYNGPFPVSIRDRKYAASYHTMIILGIEEDHKTVWVTDSATRAWAGKMQRIKRVPLKDIANYMFASRDPENEHPYFVDRRHTGGFTEFTILPFSM